VLFGSTLFGVIGAILAIPVAASIQITIKEWREYRRELLPDSSAPVQPPPAGA
jgi:predicted PurR-regulated permease PerM